MEPKLVDFSVIKQKIIKTDEVLQMYMENNKKLKKTQQAYKDLKSKYEEASNGLNRFQLESDRCTFSLQHVSSKNDKLESKCKNLEQQNKTLEEKYYKHIVDSQTAMLELENELRMIRELKESAELLSSPKKKLPSKNNESPKKIKELEEAVKKLKQNEARFKQENDKLLLERKELVGDMEKMRNEHSKIVFLSQEEKNKLVVEITGLKSQIASKQTHYNDVFLVKDKEISKLNAEVLALRGLKEQLKYLKEENKKLNNDITSLNKKYLTSCMVETQTTQHIKSVLEENLLLKTEIKTFKSRTLKCESTQTESDEEYESLDDIFKEMTVLPRMLSPMPDEQFNARTTSTQSEASREKSDSVVLESESIFKPVAVQKVVPFVIKEECFTKQSESINQNFLLPKKLIGFVSETSASESKADILICEENTYKDSMTSCLKTENVGVGGGIQMIGKEYESKLFAAEIEKQKYTKENPQFEAKTRLPTADIDLCHDISLSLADNKENVALFEESHSFKNQSSIHKENPQLESSELLLPIADSKNFPLFGASVGDSQEFKNKPVMNDLKIKENPHPEGESPLSKTDEQQNYGIALPSMNIKGNLSLYDDLPCESQKTGIQSSIDDVDIKENPQLDGESTLSTADNYLSHRLGLIGCNEQNIILFDEPVGEFHNYKNQPSIIISKVEETPEFETESTLCTATNQKNLGIDLPSMDNKENLSVFNASLCESQEIENQPSRDDADIKETPHLDSKSTTDNQLYHRFSLLSVHNEKKLPIFGDLVGDSQGFTNQQLMNVSSVKETSQLAAESTLSTANYEQKCIALPSMDNKENLPLFQTQGGESQELENKPSKIEENIREDSELVASCSNGKKYKTPQRRKYKLSSRVNDSTRLGYRGHLPNSKQIFRKEMRMRKCRRVDSVLRALQVLKRSKINFTISNESTLPLHWKDSNWLDRFSGSPADFGHPSRRMRAKDPARSAQTKVKLSTRKLTCTSKACKSMCMSLENVCGTANLLGFFNVKQEAVSPLGEPPSLGEPLDSKPDDPLKLLNDSLHSEKTMEILLEKLAELVSEKLKKDKRKRTVSPASEFYSETETELERLIEEPACDVLERHKMLLKRAKYDPERGSTSTTSLERSDSKTPPRADTGLKTEQLEASTPYRECSDLPSTVSPSRGHSLPPIVAKTAVRALWNKPAAKEELPDVRESFENADSCDSYKFPVCPNLLSPLSACATDSPKIRHVNWTPKKEDSEISFNGPGKKELQQKFELLSPIRKIDELTKLRSSGCKIPLAVESRLLYPFDVKRENLETNVNTEASQRENASKTVETSDSGHFKVLEKAELGKLRCSGIDGLYSKKLNLAPILQLEIPSTPQTANNSLGVEPHSQPSSNLSDTLENTSPPVLSTHRSFQLLHCSSLRQYSNKSKTRKSLTNSNDNCTLSILPVFGDQRKNPPLSPFVCNELLKPKAELEVGPSDGETTVNKDFSLPQTSLDKTDVLSVSSLEMDPQESVNVSADFNNGDMLDSSCISDFLANESKITKEIESFMTKFGMHSSSTQATTPQNERTSRNALETGRVPKKISASDILDILPRSYEKEKENEVPSCPQSPELQPDSTDFVAKMIPLERNQAMAITDAPITDTLFTDIPSTYSTITGISTAITATIDIPITDTPITETLINEIPNTYTTITGIPPTDTTRSEKVLPRYKKQVSCCPQSPELQPASAKFFPKVIPLERNLAETITDTPITDTKITEIPIIYTTITGISSTYTTTTGIPSTHTTTTYSALTGIPPTDTPRSEKLLSRYEKQVPICPQSPELQPASAKCFPKVIPLERNLAMTINETPITDTQITEIPITYTTITGTPSTYTTITDTSSTYTTITGIPSTYTTITGTPSTYTTITGTPSTYTTITGTSSTYNTITGIPSTYTTITGTPSTYTTITGISPSCPQSPELQSVMDTDIPIAHTTITGTPITEVPRSTYTTTTYTDTMTHTSISDFPIIDASITYTPVSHIPITDTPINDMPVTKQKTKKGAMAYSAATKDKSKATRRRSKRLSKAVISSSSESGSEEDVCDRLKESPTILNVDNTVEEQVKRKRGRVRVSPPKETLGAEKVVRKRGRPRKYPVKETSAEESGSKRSCVETARPKNIVESNKETTDVTDSEEDQKLANGVSQLSSVAPKKVVKPKQKISKLKSNVLRQMKLKQKMYQSDKPGSNIPCDVERNETMEVNLHIRNDRLCSESNDPKKIANDSGVQFFQSGRPGNNFCSSNDCDVKTNDAMGANLEIRNNMSAEVNKSRFKKLASDPDKRITVVQDIIIRAGHTTTNSSAFNFKASSSRQNGGVDVPKKRERAKKPCDILSQIMGDMDKDRPQPVLKKSVAPKKILPQGLDDKQWRKGILDIAEITHNKDVKVKENSLFSGPVAKTESGILNRGIEMPNKIKFILKKLNKANEDEIPDHVVTEIKKLQVDIIVDVIIREVSEDFVDKPDTKHFPAPLMTKTQRIYLALMLKLEQNKVEQLIDKFLDRARHYIFRRGCGLKAAIPLTRLIIGVCRIRADIHTMRMFCCDAFFYIGDLAVPILFTVLTSWIDVIPMEADVKNYPMAKVWVQLVQLKSFHKPGYNLFALKCLLSTYYGYPKERFNCDTLFEEVFHEYLRNPSQSSDLAIRLFCRNKDTKWVYKKINEFFKPLIYKIPTENENFKATTILLLGKICRQFRLKEEHDRACLAELNKFFSGLLEDDVTDLVKRSVSLTLDRLPKERIRVRNREKKQSGPKVLANERSRTARKNLTKSLPNSNWGYQNNRMGKQVRPKRKRASKKKALRKAASTQVSTEQ